MIEPINQELLEHLDQILDGNFKGVHKPIGKIRRKYHRSRATKEKIEELKKHIHDEDYLKNAIEKMALDFAIDVYSDEDRRKI